jgi:hypothetical protein
MQQLDVWLSGSSQPGQQQLLFGYLHLHQIQILDMHEQCLVACIQGGVITGLQLW